MRSSTLFCAVGLVVALLPARRAGAIAGYAIVYQNNTWCTYGRPKNLEYYKH
jgi:hypothetical protein